MHEYNYDADRHSTTYEPLSLSAMYLSDFFPNYPDLGGFLNSFNFKLSLTQHIRMINKHFDNAMLYYKMSMSNNVNAIFPVDSPEYNILSSQPSALHMYKFEIEEMIFHMRRVLDALVQVTYLITNSCEFDTCKEIKYDSIGSAFSSKRKCPNLYLIIFGGDGEYLSDKTDFIQIINDLFNSFKHSLIHDESHPIMGESMPTVITFYAKKGKYEKIIYHNHNLIHIMMGFHDTVVRILENQKKFLSKCSGTKC